ncbi:MAG TPA: PIN domain nuclease [Thermoanaerobaculia bacterium]|nr:PIN domain nuclease [Thermoanaerobaculia bacterium]
MTRPGFLIDKSALSRSHLPGVAARLEPIFEQGLAATCPIIDLEVLFSARNLEEWDDIRYRRRFAYTSVVIDGATFDRALAVQRELARTGRHRLPIPDLLIAAAAEQAELVVLHYDADFDRIAEITGQPVEWVAPRGSL